MSYMFLSKSSLTLERKNLVVENTVSLISLSRITPITLSFWSKVKLWYSCPHTQGVCLQQIQRQHIMLILSPI